MDLFACKPGFNPSEGKRVVLYDFLLDSGADVTIIPQDYMETIMPEWRDLPDAEFTSKVYGYGNKPIEIVAAKLIWLSFITNKANFILEPVLISRKSHQLLLSRPFLHHQNKKVQIMIDNEEASLTIGDCKPIALVKGKNVYTNTNSIKMLSNESIIINVHELHPTTQSESDIVFSDLRYPSNSIVRQISVIPSVSDKTNENYSVVIKNNGESPVNIKKNTLIIQGDPCNQQNYSLMNSCNISVDLKEEIGKRGLEINSLTLQPRKDPPSLGNETEEDLDHLIDSEPGIPLFDTTETPLEMSLEMNGTPEEIKPRLFEFFKNHFPDVIAKHPYDVGNATKRSGWWIYLHLKKDLPRHKKVYFLDKKSRDHMKEILKQLEEFGHIQKKDSDFAHPSFLVPRKDPQQPARLVISLKEINSCLAMQPIQVLPHIRRMLEDLKGAYFISNIDLKSAYMHFKIFPAHVRRCAFTTPWGVYCCISGCFGLNFLPGWFNERLTKILQSDPFTGQDSWLEGVFSYLDDIILMSKWQGSYEATVNHHMALIRTVVLRLAHYDFRISGEKSQFFLRECKILGFILKDDVLSIDPHRIDKIRDFPIPTTRKQLMGFLGLTASFRDFISPTISNILAVLSPLTSNKVDFKFNDTHIKAFYLAKRLLLSDDLFVSLPDPSSIKLLFTDASDKLMGGILLEIYMKKPIIKIVNKEYLELSFITNSRLYETILKLNYPVKVVQGDISHNCLFAALLNQCRINNIIQVPHSKEEIKHVILNELDNYCFNDDMNERILVETSQTYHEYLGYLRSTKIVNDGYGLFLFGAGLYLNRDIFLLSYLDGNWKQTGWSRTNEGMPPLFLGLDQTEDKKIVIRSLFVENKIKHLGNFTSNMKVENDLINLTRPEINALVKRMFNKSGRIVANSTGLSAKVISFFSRTFKKEDLVRPIFEKEAMALIFCLNESRPFTSSSPLLITMIDSRTCFFLCSPCTQQSSVKVDRWYRVIAEKYPNLDLYLIGSNENLSDFMSRLDETDDQDQQNRRVKIKDMQFDTTSLRKYINDIYKPVDLQKICEKHPECYKENSELVVNPIIENPFNKELIKVSLPLQELKKRLSVDKIMLKQKEELDFYDSITGSQSEKEILSKKNDIIYGKGKIYLPPTLIPIALSYGHLLLGHGGVIKLFDWMVDNYYVPSLRSYVVRFLASCYTCRLINFSRRKMGYFGILPIGEHPLDFIYMDIIEDLPPSSDGYKHLLMIVDGYSRFIHAYPMKSKTSLEIVRNLRIYLMSTNFVTRYILADNAPGFQSKDTTSFMESVGIKMIESAPFRSESRGIVERYNGVLQSILKKFVQQTGSKDWTKLVFLAVTQINNTIHSVTKVEPAMAIFGFTIFEKGPFALFKGHESKLVNDLELNREQVLRLKETLKNLSDSIGQILDKHNSSIEAERKLNSGYVFSKGELVLVRDRRLPAVGVSPKLNTYYKNAVFLVVETSPHVCKVQRLSNGVISLVSTGDLVKYTPSDESIISQLPLSVQNILKGPVTSDDIKLLIELDNMEILHDYVDNSKISKKNKLSPTNVKSSIDLSPTIDEDDAIAIPGNEKSVHFAPPEEDIAAEVNALMLD